MDSTVAGDLPDAVALLGAHGQCEARWPQGWRVWRVEATLPLPEALGHSLARAQLFSQGNDFTSEWARDNPSYEGSSVLRKIWLGLSPYDLPTGQSMTLWVLEQGGEMAGVVALRHPQGGVEERWSNEPTAHPRHRPKARVRVGHLGQAMAFLQARHRGQGLVRRVVEEHLAPALTLLARRARRGGMMPVVTASDAMAGLVERALTVPVVDYFKPCQGLDRQVWDYLRQARMHPERRLRQAAWLQPAQAMPGRTRARPAR